MKLFLTVVSLSLGLTHPSDAFAAVSAKKLGEIPRTVELEKEIAKLLPKKVKDWTSIHEVTSSTIKTFTSKNKTFSLKVGPEEADSGDLTRYRVELTKNGETAPLSKEPLAWAGVTVDEKYIVYEPLNVVSTTSWKEADLAKENSRSGYFQVVRYSAKTGKWIVAEFMCAADCSAKDKFEIWEYAVAL